MPKDKDLLLTMRNQANMVPAIDENISFVLERRYFDLLDTKRLELTENNAFSVYKQASDLRLLKLEEVDYQRGEDLGLHLANMQNVLASLKDDSHNVACVIKSNGTSNDVYYGVSRRVDDTREHVGTDEYARIMSQSFQGNFYGIKRKTLSADEVDREILHHIHQQSRVLAMPGIPSLRNYSDSAPYVQGLDRFIEAMRGEKYTLICIAEPIPLVKVDGMINNLFDLASSIHPLIRATIQRNKSKTDTLTAGMFGMLGDTTGSSLSDSNGWSQTESHTDTTSTGEIFMGSGGALAGAAPGVGTIIGGVIGSCIFPGLGTVIGAGLGSLVGSAAGPVVAYATGMPMGTSSGTSASDTVSTTLSFVRTIGNTAARTMGGGLFGSFGRSWTAGISVSQETLNKRAEYAEQLCEHYIKRLQEGKNLGFWNVGIYLLTESPATVMRAKGLLRATFSGAETHWEPMRTLELDADAIQHYIANFSNPVYNMLRYGQEKRDNREAVTAGAKIARWAKAKNKEAKKFFKNFRLMKPEEREKILEEIRQESVDGIVSEKDFDKAWETIRNLELGHPMGEVMGGVATPMNTAELSILTNVPRREVQGITVREVADFGGNYVPESGSSPDISIGNIIHKCEPLEKTFFSLKQDTLTKHGFICGVTGSGKTNTCFQLLSNLKVPFLVIEPAKTEYRRMLGKLCPELRVFTLGDETVSPFRLNPFDFEPGGSLLRHLDHLRAIFNAAFPMYASMPYLLEEALVGIYMDKGWELATSTNRYFDVEQTNDYSDYLPTLEELLHKIDQVVASKRYAQELSQDLSAALRARLASLLSGSKGLMLNSRRSVPIGELLAHNTVLELKSLGDDDEKCFVMGLLLARIYEYREIHHDEIPGLRHLTLIEEAHRLLRKVPEYASAEVANVRGKAVETFTNVISEIREYGEGFLIVDQIPSKLAPDVIKNTNFKLVHRTLAQDDRDLVGTTMGLNEDQGSELPLLRVGELIAHRENLDRAFRVKVPLLKDSRMIVSNETVHESMKPFHDSQQLCYAKLPGLERNPEYSKMYTKMDFRSFDLEFYRAVFGIACAAVLELDNIPAFVDNARMIAERRFRAASNDPHTFDCRLIYYVNFLMEQLNRTYPGYYDKILSAHRALLCVCFNEDQRNQQTIFRRELEEIYPESALVPLLCWLVSESAAAQKLDQTIDSNTPEKYRILDDFLKSETERAFFGISVSEGVTRQVKKEMLGVIFANTPYRTEILRQYEMFLNGGK